MKKIDSRAKVYITSQKRFDEGNLTGKWMYLSSYTNLDDFMQHCKEVFDDEDEPVAIFLDAVNVGKENFVSDYEMRDVFECNVLSDADRKLLEAWYNIQPENKKDWSLQAFEQAKEHFIGAFSSMDAFGKWYAENEMKVDKVALEYISGYQVANGLINNNQVITSMNHFFKN